MSGETHDYRPLLPCWQDLRCPIIGMLHAPALPGAPGWSGNVDRVRTAVLRDAEVMVECGISGLMLENFGDAPFSRGRVPAITVTHLAALAVELRRRFSVPLGINVLRNDGLSALAIAHAAGAAFIRVNVLSGARLTDQGLVQGIGYRLLRQRAALGAGEIRILADVAVKHSAPLAPRPLAEETRELVERGGADAVIVSGTATGEPVLVTEIETVSRSAGQVPVLVGSGVQLENVDQFVRFADGLLVGTALKRNARVTDAVDGVRVRELVARVADLTSRGMKRGDGVSPGR